MQNTLPQASRLGTDDIKSLIPPFVIPAIIGMVIVSLYNIIDRAFIGHGVGVMAISGLSLTMPISSMIAAIGTLVGVGASARISIVLGKRDYQWACNILAHVPMLTFILSSVFVLLSFLFMDELLALFGGSPDTIPYAKEYLNIVIPASILTNLCYSLSGVIRGSGNPKKSMYVLLVGVVLNIILDPIFIFVFDMGIKGAAIATAISMAVGAAYAIMHFIGKDKIISFKLENFRLKRSIIRNIISIGVSPFAINFSASCVALIVNTQLKKYGGDLAIGAFGIINSYLTILVMIILGFCQGVQPIIGYNYGAELRDRVRTTFLLTVKINTYICVAGFMIFQIFPSTLSYLFVGSNEVEMTNLVVQGLRICSALFPFIAVQIVTSQYYMAIGKSSYAIILSVLRQIVLLIPLVLLLPKVWGLTGILLSFPISDGLSTLIALVLLYQEDGLFFKKRKAKV